MPNVRLLLQFAADLHLRDPDDGSTALFAAVDDDSTEVTQELLAHGADITLLEGEEEKVAHGMGSA